jgi:hypothetical protein
LNGGELIAAAATSRSAIESAVALHVALVRHRQTLERCAPAEVTGNESALGRELMEYMDYLQAVIWGGRSSVAPLESRNVAGFLSRTADSTTDPETKQHLQNNYGLLCDVMHASALGHQVFWGDRGDIRASGQEVIELRLNQDSAMYAGIAELCIWAAGWSTGFAVRAFGLGLRDVPAAFDYPT